jgi:hypothetical protein
MQSLGDILLIQLAVHRLCRGAGGSVQLLTASAGGSVSLDCIQIARFTTGEGPTP